MRCARGDPRKSSCWSPSRASGCRPVGTLRTWRPLERRPMGDKSLVLRCAVTASRGPGPPVLCHPECPPTRPPFLPPGRGPSSPVGVHAPPRLQDVGRKGTPWCRTQSQSATVTPMPAPQPLSQTPGKARLTPCALPCETPASGCCGHALGAASCAQRHTYQPQLFCVSFPHPIHTWEH